MTERTPKMSSKFIIEKKYYDACFVGDIDTVTYMVKKEGKTLRNNSKFLTGCLKRACDGGNVEVYKMIADHFNTLGSKVWNISGQLGDVALYACKTGKLAIVVCYLNMGRYDQSSYMAMLLRSCKSGNVELIKLMLSEVYDKFGYGFSADGSMFGRNDVRYNTTYHLQNACKSGNIESVKLFIGTSDINTNWEKCFKMAYRSGNSEVIKFITQKSKLVARGDFGILYEAGKSGNVDIFNSLFFHDTPIDESYIYRYFILGACWCGHIEVVKLIFQKVNVGNLDKYIDNACRKGHIEIVKFFVEKGAMNWNIYATAACQQLRDNLEIVEYMVENGANNFNEYLYYACFHGWLDFVYFLVKKGATDWNTGLRGACNGGHVDLAQLMIKYGATDLNEILGNCENSYVDLQRVLILGGANQFRHISNTYDFKLYSMCKTVGKLCNRNNLKWLQLLVEYPPCVLLVGSIITINNKCHIKRLPKELFVLLDQF